MGYVLLKKSLPPDLATAVTTFLIRTTTKKDIALNEFQRRAIAVIETGTPVIAVAPTGAGKTAVGVAAILANGGRGIWIEPTRALMWEIYSTLREGLPNRRLVISNKDYSVPFGVIKHADIVVTSPYKALIYISSLTPKDFPVIVVDEIHNISGNPALEAAVSLAIMKGFKVYGLSATVTKEDVGYLSTWLNATPVVHTEKRPVPLRHVIYRLEIVGDKLEIRAPDAGVIGEAYTIEEATAKVVAKILSENKRNRVLVWSPWRRLANDLANYIASELAEAGIARKRDDLARAIKPSNHHDKVLASTIRYQVGIHHGGISTHNARFVEKAFRNGDLLVVVSCYTLSQGVNFPVSHVVFPLIYDHDLKPMNPSLYHQIAGRAGRPGYDVAGTSVILVLGEAEEALARMLIAADATPISPSLNNPYIIAKVAAYFLLRSGFKSFEDFVARTFTAIKAGPDGAEALKAMAREVADYVVQKYFNETGSGIEPKGYKEAIAASMMLHPIEYDIHKAIIEGTDYRDILLMTVDAAKLMGEDVDDISIENYLRSGFLAYYSRDYRTRRLADVGMSVLGTVAVFANRAYGFRSDEAQKVRDFVKKYTLGDNPILLATEKHLRFDEIKRLVRNAQRLVFGAVTGEVSSDELPDVIATSFEVIFGTYRTINLDRASKIFDSLINVIKPRQEVAEEASRKTLAKLTEIIQKNKAKVVGRWSPNAV